MAFQQSKGGSALCDSFGGDFDPDNLQRFAELVDAFSVMATQMDVAMEKRFYELKQGVYTTFPDEEGDGDGPSDLALMLGPQWAKFETVHTLENPFSTLGL
jgi:hypothetical protein